MKHRKKSYISKALALLALAASAYTGASAQSYCTPTVGTPNSTTANYSIGVGNFTFGRINDGIGSLADYVGAYQDRMSFSDTISAGQTRSVAVLSGATNPCGVNLWVDLNNDGTFAAGEILFTASGYTNIVNGSITIPSGTTPGPKRLRLGVEYFNPPTNPCGPNAYGQFKDYEIVVLNNNGKDLGTFRFVSPLVFKPGNNDITVDFYNVSKKDSIGSADVGYMISGSGSPVTWSLSGTSFNGGVYLQPGQRIRHTFPTPLSLSSGTYTLKTWAVNPDGGGADQRVANDTLSRTFCVGLNGTYTIGSGGDFTTFQAAVNVMQSCGIGGPVVFNVKPGTYNEQVSIGAILGAYGSNTVTFNGGDTSLVKLVYSSASSADPHTVRLASTKRIVFRNIQIQGLGSTYAFAVNLNNGADSNEFRNCRIYVANSSNTGLEPVSISAPNGYSTGATASQNLFDSCSTSGGYNGFNFWCSNSNGNVISNSLITNFSYCGIYMNANTFGAARGNTIQTKGSNYAGIYSSGSNTVLAGNKVGTNGAPYATYGIYMTNNRFGRAEGNIGYGVSNGIYVYDGTAPASGTNQNVVNNMAYSSGANTYGLYVYGSTVTLNNNTGSGTSYGIYLAGPTGAINCQVLNNIAVSRTAAGGSIYIGTSSMMSRMDYNNLISANPAEFAFVGVSHIDLAALKASLIIWNQNTVSIAPPFASAADLHLTPGAKAPFGDPAVGLTTDVDGEPRCAIAPLIGADENGYMEMTPPASILMIPDTIWLNSPVRMSAGVNKGGPFSCEWDFSNDGVVDEINNQVDWIFFNYGWDSVRLTITGCSGSTSIVKYVWVDTPQTVPTTNFIADKYIVGVNEAVTLNDISENGPETFLWTANPPDPAFFSPSELDPNVEVEFSAYGDYEICLETNNIRGFDIACKPAYIHVVPEFSICNDRIGGLQYGILRDPAGTGVYTKDNSGTSTRCGFLIDPCATEVSLYFRNFSLNGNVSAIGRDSVVLRNGANGAAPVIAAFSSDNMPEIGTNYVASSGKMYVEFVKVNNQVGGVGGGFDAVWTSVADPSVAAPVISLEGFDTAYINAEYLVHVNSSKAGLMYDVEIDGDFSAPEYDNDLNTDFTYTYSIPGTYQIDVIGVGCSGSDSASKTITILPDPTVAPEIHFSADRTVINLGDEVFFREQVKFGPRSWEWTFSPNSVEYTNGTNANSRNPQVRFLQNGNYTVTLKAYNNNAAPNDNASLTKTAYIRVVQYCETAVANLNTDLGISRVAIGSIDNSSAQSNVGYTNYTTAVAPLNLNRGGSYSITIERTTNLNFMNRKVWIDYDRNGEFDEVNELVAFENASKALSFTASFKVPKNVAAGPSRMRVSVTHGSDANTPCGVNAYGEAEDYAVMLVHAPDLDKPVITRIGNDTTLEVGSAAYNDLGATAYDDYDLDITSDIVTSSNVDLTTVGTYYVVYHVSDSAGNAADSVIREVRVVDTQLPVITLLGQDPDSVIVFDSWTDAGVDISDNYYTGLTPNVSSNLNTSRVGSYLVNYNVTDGSGNAAATVSRRVVVYDPIAPTVQLKAPTDTIVVDVFGSFTDPGAIGIDNYDQNVTVTKVSTVNTSVLGLYTVTYSAEDSSGNVSAATVTRYVKVVDRVAPVITLKGAAIVNHQWSSVYIDSGVVISDNYDTGLTPVVTSDVDYTTIGGPYFVTYRVADNSGNVAATVVRTVYVKAFTSVVENEFSGIELYPNPTQGLVNIELVNDSPVQIEVMNSLGQLVTAEAYKTGSKTYQVNLDGMSAGNYLVRVIQDGNSYIRKVNLIK